ncbi:hypothetical protein CPC08DRAFT_711625 [Agrocybe pediades]|nr:hypothetical protein CPC08DRAFT_711625 [Agrocybe pediades]
MVCSDCKGHEHCIDAVSPLKYQSAGKCSFTSRTCEPCQELQKLKVDIRQTCERLKKLLARHRELRTEFNHRHSPTIRDLPVEVLSRIFQAYLPDDLASLPRSSNDKSRDRLLKIALPLRLGAVCRYWRQAAWSTPSLWTRIYVNLINKKEPYLWSQRQLLQKWVQRSGSLPVDVYVSDGGIRYSTADIGTPGMSCLRVLARCADRWKSNVEVHLRRTWVKYLFSQVSKVTRTLELQKFVLTREDVSESEESLRSWPQCIIKPQQLDFVGSWPGISNNLDWSALTHVRSTSWTVKECLEVLRRAPHLVSCQFMYTKEDVGTTTSGSNRVRHINLRLLSLTPYTSESSRILRFLTAPHLQTLCCDYYDKRELAHSRTLLAEFFSRSRFPLTRLELCTDMSVSLISLLDMVPLLKSLKINAKPHHQETIDPFLQRLSVTRELSSGYSNANLARKSTTFLPCLEYLMINLPSEANGFFPWIYVPRIFGPPSDLGKPGRRPLKSLIVELQFPKEDIDVPGRGDIPRLIALRDAGAVIHFNIKGNDNKITTLQWEHYL